MLQIFSCNVTLLVIYFTQLTAPPVNARALALLSSVAGDSLHKHLPKIIPALIQSLEELSRDENEEVRNYCSNA